MELHVPGQIPLVLPEQLLRNLREVHGSRQVGDWLERLPEELGGLLEELGATIAPGEPPLSYHLVFFARCSDGQEIVIKGTVPNDEQPPEAAAVEALSGVGIGPRLLRFDADLGILVMERVVPGRIMPTELPTLERDAAVTRAVATLASRMARHVDVRRWENALVPVRTYTRALEQVDPASVLWSEHRAEILHAVELRDTMLSRQERHPVFLHGDLHHYNVLRNRKNLWTVIDPKGLIGPPGYEFGAFTYNPVNIQHHPGLPAIERQRVSIWSEVTGLAWEEVRSWGYIAAVLSACWSGEGGGLDWQDAMRVALVLRDLAPPTSPRR